VRSAVVRAWRQRKLGVIQFAILTAVYAALAACFVWLAMAKTITWRRSLVVGTAVMMLAMVWMDLRRKHAAGGFGWGSDEFLGALLIAGVILVVFVVIRVVDVRRGAASR
jgi:hypothetical protein